MQVEDIAYFIMNSLNQPLLESTSLLKIQDNYFNTAREGNNKQ